MALVPIEANSKNLSRALAQVRNTSPNYIRSSITPKRAHLEKVATSFSEALESAGIKKDPIMVFTKLQNNQGGLPNVGKLAEEVGTEGIILSISGMARNFGYYKRSNPMPAYY